MHSSSQTVRTISARTGTVSSKLNFSFISTETSVLNVRFFQTQTLLLVDHFQNET